MPKMLTIYNDTDAFQVKIDRADILHPNIVYISVLSVDQTMILYTESIKFETEKIAIDFTNEFSKSDSKRIVKTYIKYNK